MRHGIAGLVVLLSSCASIMDGGPDVLSVSSEPEGATVLLHGGTPVGKTPMQVTIHRSSNDFIGLELRLDGFHSHHVEVGKELNGWFIGNILFGGLIGIFIDMASGNMTKVPCDRPLHVVLVPSSQPAPVALQFRQQKGYRPRSFTDSRPADAGWQPVDG